MKTIYGGTDQVKRKCQYQNESQLICTLIDDQVSNQDHVLVDEYFIGNKDILLAGLIEGKTRVKSLWLAVGQIDTTLVSEEDMNQIRDQITAIPMLCPNLNICLRNSGAILRFTLDNEGYMDERFDTMGKGLKIVKNINPGNYKHLRLPIKKFNRTLELGLKLLPRRVKTLIVDDTHGKLPALEKRCCIKPQMANETVVTKYPNLHFFNEDEDLLKWMDAPEESESHLIMCTEYCPGDSNSLPVITSAHAYSGYEVQSMIYVYRHCPICETSLIRKNLITRAKSSLVAIRLIIPCMKCYMDMRETN